jgi:hypothetical protein
MWVPFDLDVVSMVMIVGMIVIFIALGLYQAYLVKREDSEERRPPAP